MNLILFEPSEVVAPLPNSDPRARHIRDVLRLGHGQKFDCGLVGGARGKGMVVSYDATGLHLEFTWGAPPPQLDPIWLLVGLPRPQTARKVLGEATAMGASRIIFFSAEKGEPSYADSSLWTSGEVRRLLVAGAEQAFCTLLPDAMLVSNLERALAIAASASTRVALDNYEANVSLSRLDASGLPAVIAVGAERGWSAAERDLLRARGFLLASLGARVLRTETACVAGLAVLKSRLSLI